MFNIKKTIVAFILGFAMVLGLIPTMNVQADTNLIQSSLNNTEASSEAAQNFDNAKLKKTIVIDPGHNYGGDTGAVSTIRGVTYKEVELNMQVASKLKIELEKRGYNVIMTRNEGDKPLTDVTQSLKDRVIIANNAKADFFISIHHNSMAGMEEANGIETYYSSAEQGEDFKGGAIPNKLEISKKMATIINDSIAQKLNINNRGVKDASLFIRSTNMPAIVVETGFITNEEEAKRCSDPIIQQKVAEIIADSIKTNI